MLEEPNSRGRALVANTASPSTDASGDGDFVDGYATEDMFYLPSNGTSRVVRGTRCGEGNTSSCGNVTAPSHHGSMQQASSFGTLSAVRFGCANRSGG